MKPLRMLLTVALAVTGLAVTMPPGAAATAPITASGSFSVLTYNVAGLPEGISSGSPAANTTAIGERIRRYDIVNVQEDFNYHAKLYAADNHPYRTPTSGGVVFGDGMNTLSAYPYSELARVKWNKCNGTDCLTPKGFTYSRIRLAEGVYVDLYNLHPNAGGTDADLAARRANISQLSDYIAANSAGNAVIVMGDTNTRYTREQDNIRQLVATNGLTDVWVQQERAGVPPVVGSPALVCDPSAVTNACEVVDKIFFRGNAFITLNLTRYNNENAAFLDAAGAPLSDHYPHAAWFTWTTTPGLQMTDPVGGPHGIPFTDVQLAASGSAVRTVGLRSGARLDQVAVTFADGRSATHGGDGGTASALTLAPGEYLTRADVATVQKDGRTRIGYLKLTSNHGRTVQGGRWNSSVVTYAAPSGFRIAGFFGRSGAEVDKLGLIYASNSR